MKKAERERERERRTDRRISAVGTGKKKVKDALAEEAVEEAFDWLERGGLRRLWSVVKVTAIVIVALIVAALIILFDS